MNGKRYSRQRELIYQALMNTDQHPTAEMVYHNLNLLADEGTIVRMEFPVERYDANVKPHPHFRCKGCGSVYDLKLPYDEGLDQQVEQISGHQIKGHELLFYGICSHCKVTH